VLPRRGRPPMEPHRSHAQLPTELAAPSAEIRVQPMERAEPVQAVSFELAADSACNCPALDDADLRLNRRASRWLESLPSSANRQSRAKPSARDFADEGPVHNGNPQLPQPLSATTFKPSESRSHVSDCDSGTAAPIAFLLCSISRPKPFASMVI
jgi:hypothetical protein